MAMSQVWHKSVKLSLAAYNILYCIFLALNAFNLSFVYDIFVFRSQCGSYVCIWCVSVLNVSCIITLHLLYNYSIMVALEVPVHLYRPFSIIFENIFSFIIPIQMCFTM